MKIALTIELIIQFRFSLSFRINQRILIPTYWFMAKDLNLNRFGVISSYVRWDTQTHKQTLQLLDWISLGADAVKLPRPLSHDNLCGEHNIYQIDKFPNRERWVYSSYTIDKFAREYSPICLRKLVYYWFALV